MIRIVVFALVAANLLYFGWSRWVGNDTAALTAVAVQPPAPPPAPPHAPMMRRRRRVTSRCR